MRPEEKPCDGGMPLGRVARMLKTGSRYLIPTRKVNASPGTVVGQFESKEGLTGKERSPIFSVCVSAQAIYIM